MNLELSGIHKVYSQAHAGETLEALRDINLTVEAGTFMSIIGPSGCGKTTLLRIICGLEQPTRGTVLLGGRKIDKPDGSIGLIFQEFALFPWRNVIDNIGFSLEMQNVPRQERRKRALFYLKKFGLEEFAHTFPKELSGGMKQRVAIARTLINDPGLLLMDEPFGSLDSQSRNAMQEFLLQVWQETGKTIIFISHNIDETVFLSQKVIGFSQRPGTIKLDLPIDLPYPRERTGQDFNRYRKTILDYLSQERNPRAGRQ